MLQKIENAQIRSYAEFFNGKSLPRFLNDIIDAINNLIQNGGNGGNNGPDVKLQSLGLNGTTLTATLSDSTSIPLALASLVSDVYEVASIAARDSFSNPTIGSVTFITDADGNGNPGISGYTGSAWTAPLVIAPGAGGSGTAYVELDDGGELEITVGYEGAGVPSISVNAAGDYTISANGSTITSLDILGNNTTVTGSGDFIIRTDGLNPTSRFWQYQIWNAANGGAVDAHAQGNNPSRTVAAGVLSLSFPNMQPYGASGFEITLR